MIGRVVSVILVALVALTAPAVRAADRPNGIAPQNTPQTTPQATLAPSPMAAKRLSDCEAAEQGDPNAAFRLARRYLFGVGVSRDRRLGTAWLRAAASRGHSEARRMVHYVPGAMGRIRPWCRPGGAPVRGITAPPAEIARLVDGIAARHGVDPGLVLAVIQAESAFRTDAVSPKDAAGLMQLIPDTAERFGVSDVFDPAQNITGGVRYLRWLLAYFQGDVTLALAGYNAGEGAVDRYRGVPPYEETQNYIRVIRRIYNPTFHPYDQNLVDPSPALAGAAAELPRSGKSPKKG